VDGKVGDHGVLGALFAYDNSSVTLGGDGSHATIESYSGGLYGSYHEDGFYVNALGAYTRNDYNTNRNISISGFGATADGSTNGDQATANIDGGYDWNATNRLSVGPLAGLQYVHLGVDGFNESGAGPADLALGSQNMNSLQTRLGAHANYHLASTPTSSFALDFHAAWQHEYLDDSRGIGANFEGLGTTPFSVQTASPLRDAAVVGLGVNWTLHDRLTLFAEYELELWNASNFEQTVNGGARISF
jgi:fibronectin-binding autotransporter adhesin